MALATLNGLDVVEARIALPRVGVWTADLVTDPPPSLQPVTGAVTLAVDGGLTLAGTVTRSGIFNETMRARVSGGADGMRRTARPRFYTAASVRVVLGDLLRDAGERVSATSAPGVLGASLASWTTIAQPTGNVVAVLLARAAPAAAWRLLPDGSLWVGLETWPDSGLGDAELDALAEQGELAAATYGTAAPALRPGTTLAGRRVGYVDHVVRPSEIRTRVRFEPAL